MSQCPGYYQCNLVVLPKSVAFDFLLFCERNPQPLPLLEVCEVGCTNPSALCIAEADIRSDLPAYNVYREGKLEQTTTDITDLYPSDGVAFLYGCSFSVDCVLAKNKIPQRSLELKRKIPIFRTNIKLREAGMFKLAYMVVTMRPVKSELVSKVTELTSQFPKAHGGPVHIGDPAAIGITDITKPDWGDPVPINPGEIMIFHACGVSAQEAIINNNIPFAITHAPGQMFITDTPI